MQLVFEKFGVGVVSDGNKDAFNFEKFGLVGFDVFDFYTADAERVFGSDDFFNHAIPFNMNFGVLFKAFLKVFVGTQGIAAVNEGYGVGKAGEVDCLIDSGIAAANHGDIAVAVEKSVTSCAGRDAETAEFGFAVESEPASRSTVAMMTLSPQKRLLFSEVHSNGLEERSTSVMMSSTIWTPTLRA
jgi:hypothetical protein